jgi:crossover junction endodeoxyribonuclease RuvC
MRILGIDPGTGITGFGVIDVDGQKYKLVDAGVIRTTPNTPLEERLEIIYNNLKTLTKEHKPDVMAVEKLFFAQNVTTAISVSHARGVILLVAKQSRAQVAEYTPLQIKQALTGDGRAQKSQIQEMVRVMLGLKNPPKPDDCADALATAICHAMNI